MNLRRLARLYDAPATASEQADIDACEKRRTELLASNEPLGDVFEVDTGKSDVTTVGAETKGASCPPQKALFLYRLVQATKPDLIVEFGSALGVSGSYLASALRTNGRGRLVTVEGSPSRQVIAAASIESVAPGVTTSICGFFDDHLDALDGASLFFNDGNHHADAVLRYAEAALTSMARPALLVVDDVNGYSEKMNAAWKQLSNDKRFSDGRLVDRVGLLTFGEPRSGLARLLRR